MFLLCCCLVRFLGLFSGLVCCVLFLSLYCSVLCLLFVFCGVCLLFLWMGCMVKWGVGVLIEL